MLEAWNSTAEHSKQKDNKNIFSVKNIFIGCMAVILVIALTIVSVGNHLVCIRDGSNSVVLMTMSVDVNDIFDQAGVKYEPDDEIVRNSAGSRYTEFSVLRAFKVKVTADGQEKFITLTHGLVPDALDAAGVHMNSSDMLNVSPYTPLSDGMEIKVDRVEYVETGRVEEIPYESVTHERKSMLKGEKIWIQYGVAGERKIVETSKYINGELISTEEVSNEVVAEPITEIIWIGIAEPPPVEKPKPAESPKKSNSGGTEKSTTASPPVQEKTKEDKPADSGSSDNKPAETDDSGGKTFRDGSGNLVSYRKLLEGPCTAYTYNNGHNITASGLPAAPGRVAVDPKVIPYGTRLYIADPNGKWTYGYCVAADTGSFVWNGSGTVADLFYDSYNTCIQFGRRNMKIYIL